MNIRTHDIYTEFPKCQVPGTRVTNSKISRVENKSIRTLTHYILRGLSNGLDFSDFKNTPRKVPELYQTIFDVLILFCKHAPSAFKQKYKNVKSGSVQLEIWPCFLGVFLKSKKPKPIIEVQVGCSCVHFQIDLRLIRFSMRHGDSNISQLPHFKEFRHETDTIQKRTFSA